MKPHVENAPGLVWRKKAGGWEALWRARRDLIEKGFTPKNVPLWKGVEPEMTDAQYIQDQCQRLQADMLAFGRGEVAKALTFDGTIKTLIYCYQTDVDSNYHKKRWAVRRDHDNFLKRVAKKHGDERLDNIRARLILKWHKEWSHDGQKIAIAHSFVAHLRTLFGFGTTILEDPECERLVGIMHLMKFPQAKARTEFLTADHVIAIRKVARGRRRYSISLAQAFQFDLMLRQKDVIGEYVPIPEPGISDVINPKLGKKWITGIRWEEIDQNMVLRHKTSKRSKDIEVNLKLAPMVIEELGTDDRSVLPASGPIIISESTGLPYATENFRKTWRENADLAGVPKTIKNMDTRSGAISEATDAGADLEHVRHAATHSDIGMTQRYSRGATDKVAGVMQLRADHRNKPKTK
jgi:hypothetical protein